MKLGLVIPAWRRADVTRLCLAQKLSLRDALATRGDELEIVVVADDENLDVAREFDCQYVEMENRLGAKINAGFAFLAEERCTHIAFAGSDSWTHPDVIELHEDAISCGSTLTHVDLAGQRLRQQHVRRDFGTPWIFPREFLGDFAPLDPNLERGVERALVTSLALRDRHWVSIDPDPLCRVELKTSVNMTPYAAVGWTTGPDQSLDVLYERWESDLVDLLSTAVAA